MNINQGLTEVFNIFHDGAIENYKGNSKNLILKIECSYLSELVNKNFNYFYLELNDLFLIELDVFRQSDSKKLDTLKDFTQIFSSEIQIYSSEIIDDVININCWKINDLKDYIGNNLKIKCDNFQLFTEDMNKITLEYLSKISENYWYNFK